MRKYLIGVFAAVAAFAFAGAAAAQAPAPSHELDAKITPMKAGTKKKPRAAKMSFKVTNNPADKTTAGAIEVLFPAGTRINLEGLPRCTALILEKMGPNGCENASKKKRIPGTKKKVGVTLGSKIGEGTAKARAFFGADLEFAPILYAGPKNTIVVWLDQVGGDIDLPLIGKLTKARGKFSQRLHIDIPATVYAAANTCCSQLDEIAATIGAKYKKGGKTFKVFPLETSGCPKGNRWTIGSRLLYVMRKDLGSSIVGQDALTEPSRPTSSNSVTSRCKR